MSTEKRTGRSVIEEIKYDKDKRLFTVPVGRYSLRYSVKLRELPSAATQFAITTAAGRTYARAAGMRL